MILAELERSAGTLSQHGFADRVVAEAEVGRGEGVSGVLQRGVRLVSAGRRMVGQH